MADRQTFYFCIEQWVEGFHTVPFFFQLSVSSPVVRESFFGRERGGRGGGVIIEFVLKEIVF